MKEVENMLVKTRFFGEVDIEDEKILTFDNGIMGFEDMKRWTLIYDIEKGSEGPISWFQSLDMAELALPVINPYTVTAVYEPVVEDELLKPLGEFKDEELVTFLTIPILINPVNRKGIQVIVNNEDYPIKFSIYESVQKMKAEKNK